MGGWGRLGGWLAGLVENKANSARPAKLKLATSWGWAELGNMGVEQNFPYMAGTPKCNVMI